MIGYDIRIRVESMAKCQIDISNKAMISECGYSPDKSGRYSIRDPFSGGFPRISRFKPSPESSQRVERQFQEHIHIQTKKWLEELPIGNLILAALKVSNTASVNTPNIIEIFDDKTSIPWEAIFDNHTAIKSQGLFIYRKASNSHPRKCCKPECAYGIMGHIPRSISRKVKRRKIKKMVKWAAGGKANLEGIDSHSPNPTDLPGPNFHSIDSNPLSDALNKYGDDRIRLFFAIVDINGELIAQKGSHMHPGHLSMFHINSFVLGVFPLKCDISARNWTKGNLFAGDCVRAGALIGVSTYGHLDSILAAKHGRCVTEGVFSALDQPLFTNVCSVAQNIRYMTMGLEDDCSLIIAIDRPFDQLSHLFVTDKIKEIM